MFWQLLYYLVSPGVYVLAATVVSCVSRCICSGSYRIILCFQVYMFWQLPYYLVFPGVYVLAATVLSCDSRYICSRQLQYYLVFPGVYVLAATVLSCVSRCICSGSYRIEGLVQNYCNYLILYKKLQ